MSRGESVEIGGGFRIPDVVAQSGARLIDVGTTNRTTAADYVSAIQAAGADIACVLRVHPSNFSIKGFTTSPTVAELSDLGVPVIVDLGSGLVDASCPWLPGPPPPWLSQEPAARQMLDEGAGLVTFSGDKLLGGPQAGVIAGRADLVAQCARHPLSRALRPGSLVLQALQDVVLAYLRRNLDDIPFWRQATVTVTDLRQRAERIIDGAGPVASGRADLRIEASKAVPGAGTAPGTYIDSVAITVAGDHMALLRHRPTPIIAHVSKARTWCDLRTVEPADDHHLASALETLGASRR